MCTVTYIPSKNRVLFSSNRDESPLRKKALPPIITKTRTGDYISPTDGFTAGTWVAAHDSGIVMVLLNGAPDSVPSLMTYSKSRGLVVTQLLAADNPFDHWNYIPLEAVAPFTIILWEQFSLFELTWNGHEKHCHTKNAAEPHIWSSSTLYDANDIAERVKWFTTWLNQNSCPDSGSLYRMLQSHNNDRNGFVMNREDRVRSLSISIIEMSGATVNFSYFDLITGAMSLLAMDLKRKHEIVSLQV